MKTAVRGVPLACGLWVAAFAGTVDAAEIVIYGFEGTTEGWEIPSWAKGVGDYVSHDLQISTEVAQEGTSCLAVQTAFPGDRWTGAYVERMIEVTDWGAFGELAVSVSLPSDAPTGLEGRIILTVGSEWQWTEMNRALSLTPGAWTTIRANLKPGSLDWKFFPDETFRRDVRKVGVRIESNGRPAYMGPVFLDNVTLSE